MNGLGLYSNSIILENTPQSKLPFIILEYILREVHNSRFVSFVCLQLSISETSKKTAHDFGTFYFRRGGLVTAKKTCYYSGCYKAIPSNGISVL